MSLRSPEISGELRTGTLEIFVVFVAIGDVITIRVSGVVTTKVGVESVLVLGKTYESKIKIFPVSIPFLRRIERGRR